MLYSTRKFWRVLILTALLVLAAGKVPWGAIRAKLGLWQMEREKWQMELEKRLVEHRLGDMLQRALDRVDRSIRDWGK